MLCEENQVHLMDGWPLPGTDDEDKHRFFRQARRTDRIPHTRKNYRYQRYHRRAQCQRQQTISRNALPHAMMHIPQHVVTY